MKTRPLGTSGLTVGAVGLGCMYLSIRERPSEDDAVRTIHAALDAGVTLLDTADVYCLDQRDIGHNERIIARALREKPGASAVVATKGGSNGPMGHGTSETRAPPICAKRASEACAHSGCRGSTSTSSTHLTRRPASPTAWASSRGFGTEGKIAHVLAAVERERSRDPGCAPDRPRRQRSEPVEPALSRPRDGRGPRVLREARDRVPPLLPIRPAPTGARSRSRAWGSLRRRRRNVPRRPIGWFSRGCWRRAQWSSPSPERDASRASSTARRRRAWSSPWRTFGRWRRRSADVGRPLRFLHTADWQLGLKLAFVARRRWSRARFQRVRGRAALGDRRP